MDTRYDELEGRAAMKAIVSHATALRYWRYEFPLDSDIGAPVTVSNAESLASTSNEVLGCVPEYLLAEGEPVEVLVPGQGSRRKSTRIEPHVLQLESNQGAFYRVGQMYVSSPELLFLQMAPRLPLAKLIALGCELCGTYALRPRGTTAAEAVDSFPARRSALTSTGNIQRFLDSAGKARGIANARRALKYVVDGSRSPMETMTYLLLCLPPMLGGYGLPKPVMNARIELDAEGRKIANRGHAEGDLCWPDAKFDIEYHSDLHVGKLQMRSDVGRTLGIEHMGWKVVTVTWPQVFDLDRFETVARDAARHLGHRLHKRVLGVTQPRLALREELESWMATGR